MSMFQDQVRHFMALGRQATPEKISSHDRTNLELRAKVMMEEIQEFQKACWRRSIARSKEEIDEAEAEMMDALIDINYTTFGTMVTLGIDGDPFWDEVHRSNMSKVDGSLGPIRFRADGKILKPPGWTPPDLLGILRRMKEKENE